MAIHQATATTTSASTIDVCPRIRLREICDEGRGARAMKAECANLAALSSTQNAATRYNAYVKNVSRHSAPPRTAHVMLNGTSDPKNITRRRRPSGDHSHA